MKLPYDPAMSLLDIYSKQLKLGSQRVPASPCSFAVLFLAKIGGQPRYSSNRWMDKENMIFIYNGTLALKKEILPICDSMDTMEDIMMGKWTSHR